MAQWYRGAGCPFLVVANKLDKLKKSEVEGNLQRIRETLELGEEDMVIPLFAERDRPDELLRPLVQCGSVILTENPAAHDAQPGFPAQTSLCPLFQDGGGGAEWSVG